LLRTRIAFTLIDRRLWSGGFRYQVNLFRLLAKYRPGEVSPVVFHAAQAPFADLAELAAIPGVELVPSAHVASRSATALPATLICGRDWAASREFDQHGIDLIFESARFFGWWPGRPVVAWLPDLQHRFLPELFRKRDYWRRELGFRAQLYSGRDILLSSEDSRSLFISLYGAPRRRTHVARFAVLPEAMPTAADARMAARTYGLPDVFTYMPNQFWKHKNHMLVAEALGLLKRQGRTVVVLATGATEDPRNPGHFRQLTARVQELGIADRFLFPGQIPYAHVVALLRACSAMLNPSLFEGWSTTVEEARALGVPTILSDIRVHREQMGEAGSYFEPHSAAQLAECLERVGATSQAERDQRLALGLESAAARSRVFVNDFVEAMATSQAREKGTR
jgi:glycosyltransferase involved in cell wall biosynthesis